ncbi:MAG: hypothetical protein FJ290_33195 [Planctomycetes bacterium]|nr:hypothetical protein [Planctomycetota bacterium]
MAINPDFRDLFIAFNGEGVEYLLVGAHAVGYYTEPRYTKDMDLWVRATADNAQRVYRALAHFMGEPPFDVAAADFENPNTVYQIGVAPNRVDIVAGLEGIDFEGAWVRRVETTYGDVPIHLMGREDLIQAKKLAARPLDLVDLEGLERSQKEKASSRRKSAPGSRRAGT